MIRLGLIGAGKHAVRYAHHIRHDVPGLVLTGVARRDAARADQAARQFGCRPYRSYEELVAGGEIDAVVAVVPPTLHADIVARAAAAGKPVLIEKPAAPNLADGRRMLEALAAHPVPVMVAQTLRYSGAVRAALEHRHRLGPIRSLSFSQGFEPSPLDWLDDPQVAGGGMVLHTGIHMFDLVRLLSGLEADRVTCQIERIRTRRTEDTFAATIRLGGGAAVASVCGSRTLGGRPGHIEVAGENGVLVADHVLNRAELLVGRESRPLVLAEPVPTVREVVRDFAECLRLGRPVPIPVAEGLRAVAIADACYRAAHSGTAAAVEVLPVA